MDSPFDVLGLPADADDAAIEEAYRDRVKEAHPDQGGSVEEFQAVRAAYETLVAGSAESFPETEPVAGSAAEEADENVAGEEETDRDVEAEVTYLDYDVLADFGWGVDDADLFDKAAAADLATDDYGQFYVESGETLLQAAENRGFVWPFACRGGACANCAIMLRGGEVSMPVDHILPNELMDRGIRLSCNAVPLTDELEVVYNVKHMPELEELLLPPRPFEQAYSDD